MKKGIFVLIMFMACSAFAQTDVIWPNPNWVGVYGGNPTLDGDGLLVGDVIRAYDAQNNLCGIDTVKLSKSSEFWTKYGFMPIYGDDVWTSGDQGWGRDDSLVPGQPVVDDGCNYIIHFTINNKHIKETLRVTEVGAMTKITAFTSCCVKRGDLTGDGVVDISDLAAMIGAFTINNACMRAYIYNCPDVADVNASGGVDISDLVSMINYMIFKGYKLESCQ
jgi:hypothetical protein